MMVQHDISWSTDIEHSLERLRIICLLRSKYHKHNYLKMISLLKYFRIPIIILSATSSVFNVALTPYMPQQYLSLLCCFISLVAGLIGSIELFLQIQKTMETDLLNSKDFYLISIDIAKMLQLNRNNRNCSGRIYLDDKFNLYKKLVESSVITDNEIHDNIISLSLLDTLSDIEKIKLINENISVTKIIDMRNENYDYSNNFLQNIQRNLRDTISHTPRFPGTPRHSNTPLYPGTPHIPSTPRTPRIPVTSLNQSTKNLDVFPKIINRKNSLGNDNFFSHVDRELYEIQKKEEKDIYMYAGFTRNPEPIITSENISTDIESFTNKNSISSKFSKVPNIFTINPSEYKKSVINRIINEEDEEDAEEKEKEYENIIVYP